VNCAKVSNCDRFYSQNLYTMSASCFSFWGLPQTSCRSFRWTQLEEFRVPGPVGCSPQTKIPGGATAEKARATVIMYVRGARVILVFLWSFLNCSLILVSSVIIVSQLTTLSQESTTHEKTAGVDEKFMKSQPTRLKTHCCYILVPIDFLVAVHRYTS